MIQKRFKHSTPVENDDGEFLWLVSLSDLMILLFVFFVVMYSFAYKQTQGSEFAEIKKMIMPQSQPQTVIVDEIQIKLLEWIKEKRLQDHIKVLRNDEGIVIQLKEKIYFEPGASRLSDDSLDYLSSIGQGLEKIPPPFRIGIEGHADASPMKEEGGLDGNWKLSSERALFVLSQLHLSTEVLKRVVIFTYSNNSGIKEKNLDEARTVRIRIF